MRHTIIKCVTVHPRRNWRRIDDYDGVDVGHDDDDDEADGFFYPVKIEVALKRVIGFVLK